MAEFVDLPMKDDEFPVRKLLAIGDSLTENPFKSHEKSPLNPIKHHHFE